MEGGRKEEEGATMGEEWEGKRKMYGETKESGERMEARIENTEEERAAKEEKRGKEGEKQKIAQRRVRRKKTEKKQEQRIEKKRIEKRRYKRGDKRETATREKTKERRQKRGGKSHCHCQRARYRYCGTASLRVRTISPTDDSLAGIHGIASPRLARSYDADSGRLTILRWRSYDWSYFSLLGISPLSGRRNKLRRERRLGKPSEGGGENL